MAVVQPTKVLCSALRTATSSKKASNYLHRGRQGWIRRGLSRMRQPGRLWGHTRHRRRLPGSRPAAVHSWRGRRRPATAHGGWRWSGPRRCGWKWTPPSERSISASGHLGHLHDGAAAAINTALHSMLQCTRCSALQQCCSMTKHLAVHGEHGGLGIGAAHELDEAAPLARWYLHIHDLAKALEDRPELVLCHLPRARPGVLYVTVVLGRCTFVPAVQCRSDNNLPWLTLEISDRNQDDTPAHS